jgi:hypothetical protein
LSVAVGAVYWAELDYANNTTLRQDEYTVRWVVDGGEDVTPDEPPTIRVIDRDTGADLVTETAMTAVGAEGIYVLNVTGSAHRVVYRKSAVVVLTAIINEVTYTRWKTVQRLTV